MTLDRRRDDTWSSILRGPETPPTPLLALHVLSPTTTDAFLEKEKAYYMLVGRRHFPESATSHFFRAVKRVSGNSLFQLKISSFAKMFRKKLKFGRFKGSKVEDRPMKGPVAFG
jgi:hypothetical protein